MPQFHWNLTILLLTFHMICKCMSGNTEKYENHLLLFISITSGPHHAHYRNAARDSWLIPCIESPLCDYRFFVDIDQSRLLHINDTAGVYEKVLLEQMTHKDLVFRDSCPLMKRHPPEINYGNSPIAKENMEKKDEYGTKIPVPDYPYRRIYKIDWKICFLKWIYEHYSKEVDFHAFVEDDSYSCTKNLLYQLALVKPKQPSYFHFRMGWPMYDGFDDSSTLMDNEVAKVFAKNYPSQKLNCSIIEDSWNTTRMSAFDWSAWGNSWRSVSCNWRKKLKENFHLNVSTPDIRCMEGLYKVEEQSGTGTKHQINLPCVRRPIVYHHWAASSILMKEEGSGREHHVCEYMLLIDKIKDPNLMHILYNNSKLYPQHYHDFSTVFIQDKGAGWKTALVKLQEEEKQCEIQHHNVSATQSLYCLFEQPYDQKRKLMLLKKLYPNHRYSRNHSLRGKYVVDSVADERTFSYQDFVGNAEVVNSLVATY